MFIADTIKKRYSCRAFIDRPVDRKIIEEILEIAKFSPSGANSQPWEVVVAMGNTRDILSKELCKAAEKGQTPRQEFDYYPEEWTEPYKTRRFQCGMGLYSLLGIDRKDTVRRKNQWVANYNFFNAPVALFFSIDKCMAQGAIMDMGIFLQSIMLAAYSFGLGSCPQAALAFYPDIAKPILHISDSKILLCGMSIGYPDPNAPVNTYRPERIPLSSFVKWFD